MVAAAEKGDQSGGGQPEGSSGSPSSTDRSVGLERWTVYLLLSAQIMNNLAIRFGLPALIFFMQQEYRWSPAQLARVTGAFFPGCASWFTSAMPLPAHVRVSRVIILHPGGLMVLYALSQCLRPQTCSRKYLLDGLPINSAAKIS